MRFGATANPLADARGSDRSPDREGGVAFKGAISRGHGTRTPGKGACRETRCDPSNVTGLEGRGATLKGTVGDGPVIKLTSNRGWISVRKEGTLPSEVLPDTPGDRGPRPPMPPKPPKTPKDLKDSEIKM